MYQYLIKYSWKICYARILSFLHIDPDRYSYQP